jgi:hypothetical protein
MPNKSFNISYFIDYAAPPIHPNNVVLLGSGGGAPAGPNGISPARPLDRILLSYRREIRKKNGKLIGEASYLVNIYKVELSNDKKSGTIWSTYTSVHELYKNKDGDEYNLSFEGKFKFKLGMKPGSDPAAVIDPSFPYLYIVGNNVENVSATSVFKNKTKINYGDCVTMFNTGKYNIKGRIGKYGTTA